MNNDNVTIRKDIVEGMFQYIEDEIVDKNISSETGKSIISCLYDEDNINDIYMMELIDRYLLKFSKIL